MLSGHFAEVLILLTFTLSKTSYIRCKYIYNGNHGFIYTNQAQAFELFL